MWVGLPKKKKDREISVRAPDYIPKREPIFNDTTGTEALDVFKVAETIGRGLSFVMVAVGIFVAVLGALNIFCGLLLLAKK
jgi:hypothetical protein